MIDTKSTLSLIRGGFTEQFVKVMSPVELGNEIREARDKYRRARIRPAAQQGIDLVA